MQAPRRQACIAAIQALSLVLWLTPARAQSTKAPNLSAENAPRQGASADVPLDDWAYPAIERLAALGYVQTGFLGLRPWTRAECARLVQEAEDRIDDDDALPPDIHELLMRLRAAFAEELGSATQHRAELRSVYSRTTVVSGRALTDSYHFGETLTNDYGRPYAEGFNQIMGASGSAQLGRVAFNARAEFQHSPSIAPLGSAAVNAISQADGLPVQPSNGASTHDSVAVLDATAAVSAGGLQFTAGKQSLWWGPGRGSSMILSNNATPIYMLRVSQVHAVQLPSILEYLGPMRFESFFGHLDGHHFPASPFFYGQKISLKPTPDIEFGFSRSVVFAGQGVTPLTFGTFAHSFFSVTSGTVAGFNIRNNPGARHGGFDFSWRLPRLRRWGVVLYTDSVAHDDVSPVSAPRRAAINPGLYIARAPFAPRLEVRAEAVSTDPPVSRSNGGKFLYWEGLYRDAYTNDGGLMGSWIGREGKGGQFWLTYHLSARSTIETSYRRSKLAKDFIAGGGTQDDFRVQSDFPLRPNLSASAVFQVEHWTIPVLAPTPQTNVTTSFQVVWSPFSHLK